MKKLSSLSALLLLLCFFSCKKEHTPVGAFIPPPNTAAVHYPVVNVAVGRSSSDAVIAPDFEGLSFETQILVTNPDFLNAQNTVLIRMIKNLGPGILRIGGGTSDEIFWSATGNTGPDVTDSLSRADIDRLSAFSKAIGWKVLFGLNLGSNDAVAAADEAQYVQNALGDNLYALQSGNEPDAFIYGIRQPGYRYADFQGEWDHYLSAIEKKLPGAPFAGPDVAYNSLWEAAFAGEEHANLKLLDEHYYVAGPATSTWIDYHTILTDTSELSAYLQPIRQQSALYGIPYRLSETNNIWGGGKPGTSDVFASALWALDATWTVAENNGSGINFHDGVGLYYSPVAIQNNMPVVSPEYYAMLAFKYGTAGGTIIPANIAQHPFCSAYASMTASGKYHVTLVNRDEKNTYSFRISLPAAASSVSTLRLSAPSVTAAAGTTFGGATVAADGTFQIKTSENSTISGKSFTVTVPACSAAVVTAQ